MTIKETAGKIILLLYAIQTNNPAELETTSITFQMSSGAELDADGWLESALHEISDNDSLLYNAFNYLLEKGFISKRNRNDILAGLLLVGPHLTAEGVDIIEGIEQGEEKQKVVKSLFNFNFTLNPTMKVDSLVKAEVGNIVGVGGAINGKVEI